MEVYVVVWYLSGYYEAMTGACALRRLRRALSGLASSLWRLVSDQFFATIRRTVQVVGVVET